MSVWKETKKAVNTRVESPVNHLLWLNDYKISGEESYVFYDKSKLYELYRDGGVCLHDTWIYEEATAWCLSNDYAGPFLSEAWDLDEDTQASLAEINNISDIMNNADLLGVLFENITIMRAIQGNATAFDALLVSSIAIKALAKSTLAMSLLGSNAEFVSAIIADSTALEYALNNPVAAPYIVTNSAYMSKVAEDFTLMTRFSEDAMLLNAVIKNSSARNTFAKSTYIQEMRTKIASAVTNTTYFEEKEKNATHTDTDDARYINGKSIWVLEELKADNSLVFVTQIYTENKTNKSTVTGLLKNDTIAGTSDGWSDMPYLFVGGLKSVPYSTGSSYDSHGVKTSVYVAK